MNTEQQSKVMSWWEQLAPAQKKKLLTLFAESGIEKAKQHAKQDPTNAVEILAAEEQTTRNMLIDAGYTEKKVESLVSGYLGFDEEQGREDVEALIADEWYDVEAHSALRYQAIKLLVSRGCSRSRASGIVSEVAADL